MNQNKIIGNLGENIAAQYLHEKGYTLLEKNWRYQHLEIDIIASKNKKLHIVEVKTRTSAIFGNPEESVDNAKMKHLKTAAEAYMYQHPNWQQLQFDVVAITLKKGIATEILLLEDVYW